MGCPNGIKLALEGLQEVESVVFEPASGRFEAIWVEAAIVSKAQIVALIASHSAKSDEDYQIVWGEPRVSVTETSRGPAEAFEVQTLARGRYDLAGSLGERPIVLVFWASWCGPCVAEAPHLVELHARYGDQVEFVSISIDAQEDHGKLREVVAALKIPYVVGLDPDGSVLAKYASGGGIPLTFLIDARGEIVYRHENYEADDELLLRDAIVANLP